MHNRVFLRLLSLGDQVVFAGGNFLLTILLTRFFTDKELAAYGMAVSFALILQGIQRNSYVIQNSLLNDKILKNRGKKILAEQIIAVVPLLLLLIITSFLFLSLHGEALSTLTLVATTTCFAIYAQLEFERMVLMKYRKFLIPFATSCAYALIIATLILCHSFLNFYQIMAILLIFACLKSFILLYVVGVPDFKGGWMLLRSDLRRNSLSSILGVIGYTGYMHTPVLFLGSLSTPMEAAAYVAMRALMQPLQIIVRSMDIIDKNFFRERASHSKHGVKHVMNRQIILYGVTSLLLSIVICAFSSDIIHLFYGGKYLDYRKMLYAWAVIVIFYSMLQPVESAIIMKKLLNKYNLVRLCLGIGTCVFMVLVAPLGSMDSVLVSMTVGIAGFAWGVIIVNQALNRSHPVKKPMILSLA